HVFYDGEEKIVTNWSCATSTVPAESVGSIFAMSVGPGPIEYIGPIDQYDPGAYQYPGHPCSTVTRQTIYEDGHSYPSYTDISWGFSGSVDLQVNGYGRSRINVHTEPDGGLFHEPGFDWGNGGGFACCGGSGSAVAYFTWQVWSQRVKSERIDSAQSRSGTSALILLPADREAVCGIRKIRDFHHDGHQTYKALLRGNQWRVSVQTILNNGCTG